MAQPIYTYEVSDLMTGQVLAELPLSGVKYSKRLNDSGQLGGSFLVESRSNPRRRVKDPYDLTTPCRRVITAWRDDRPMWEGIIWTRRYNSTSGVVELGCADYWSYFDHRYVLPLLPANRPQSLVAGLAVRYTNAEQNAIARALVAQAQAHTGGDIRVQLDASSSDIYRDRTYEGHQLETVGDALRKLAGVINGPDLLFDVGGPDAQGRPVRRLRIGEPYLGQQGSAHVWEYGANILEYSWPSDGSRYASRPFAIGDGAGEGAPIAVVEDTTRYAQGWPLMESEESYSGVTEASTLDEHAEADQLARRLPVVLPTLTVRGDADPVVGKWDIGDDAQVAIEDDFLPGGIDTLMRIIAADITPGEERETVVLTMAPLLDDVA